MTNNTNDVAALDVETAEPLERLPFDPFQPIELSDGSPCVILSRDPESPTWHWNVRVDGGPVFDGGYSYFFTKTGGFSNGSKDGDRTNYPHIVNVDPTIPEPVRRARNAWLADAAHHPDFMDADWFAPYAMLHFPLLVERDDVAMVSFFENERKLEADRRTEMRVGRYVRRFNGGKLKDEDVERIAAASDVKLRGNRVKITQDADEIEQVYRYGPRSCMAGSAYDFDTDGIHPARVYAGPDLALAYIGEPTDASARCVVWPEKKVYSTIYGDVSRMSRMLESLGYEEGGLRGARVRLIECDYGVVMPYVDGVSNAEIDGKYVVLGRGYEVECSNTNGLGQDSARAYCDRCEDRVPEDDIREVFSARYSSETWCSSCVDYSATYCSYVEEYVVDDCMTTVHLANGSTDACAEWALERNDFVEVEEGAQAGEWWHVDATAEHDGSIYHVDDVPEEGEDAALPLASHAELEAAGQMRLALPDPAVAELQYRLMNRRRSDGLVSQCFVRSPGETDGATLDLGTYEEVERQRERLAGVHGAGFDYWIEPAFLAVEHDGKFYPAELRERGVSSVLLAWERAKDGLLFRTSDGGCYGLPQYRAHNIPAEASDETPTDIAVAA